MLVTGDIIVNYEIPYACRLILSGYNTDPLQFLWFWFLFYGPSTHFRSFRARSVTLITLFLDNPPRQFTNTYCTFFASNWQLLFLNQRKRKNGRRNVFVTKSPRKNVSYVGIELGTAFMPTGHTSDRATTPGFNSSGHPSRLTTKPTQWHVSPTKTVRMKKARVLSYPLSAQWRLWSDTHCHL